MKRLCAPAHQILLKAKKTKPVFEKDELIKLNEIFKGNNTKLNLKPVMGAKAAAGDKGAIDSANSETQKERSFVIEAVLVRNMKAKKTENIIVLTNLVI